MASELCVSDNKGLAGMSPEQLIQLGDKLAAKAGRELAEPFYTEADRQMWEHASGLASLVIVGRL